MIRTPVVAGRFYPGDERSLAELVDSSLVSTPSPAIGVMSPHAGYVYSGGVAGKALSAATVTGTVLLLGPNHTGRGTEASIMSFGVWSTPLGESSIDAELAAGLTERCPHLHEDSTAHAFEHSLEVQLPFLQRMRPGVMIVPIAFMMRSLERMREVGTAIGQVLKGWREPVLMVASSDMTHYEPSEVAAGKDRLAIERILALDPEGLFNTVAAHGISMCGVIPATVMLFAALELGAQSAEEVEYSNSGDVSGDYSSVVGYAGVVVR